MPIAADNASDRVEQLTILTERLAGLVESEIEFLQTRRPAELTQHTGERDKLAAIYAKEMTLIHKDRRLIDQATPALLKKLKTATAGFREALSRHTNLVEAMRTVSEGILKSVAEQANAKHQTVTGYGKDASLRAAQTKRPASLALNEMI